MMPYFRNGFFSDALMFAPLPAPACHFKGHKYSFQIDKTKVCSNHLFKKILVEIGFGPSTLLQIYVAPEVAIGLIHCQNL